MTEYQRITLKESGEEIVVSTMEYPYAQAGILYIKFIAYEEYHNRDYELDYDHIKFLTVQPQDILKREYEWSQEAEDELVAAAEEAMARRAALLQPPPADGDGLVGLFG